MKNSVNIHSHSLIEELSDEQAMNVCGGMGNTFELTTHPNETPGSSYPSLSESPPPPPPLPPIDELKPPYSNKITL